MQPRPAFDRTLLIPIAIGVVSLLGILVLLVTSVLGQLPSAPTATPSRVSSLATRTRTPTPTETSPLASPEPPTETPTSTSIPVTASALPPSATPTPEGIQPLSEGTYDDLDPNIVYGQYWTVLKNNGTKNAYGAALHVSNVVGEAAYFRFSGTGVWLGYQRGMNFGTVTVLIDGQPYSFHEQEFQAAWRSPELEPGEHFVRIIHDSGEYINLDYIQILP